MNYKTITIHFQVLKTDKSPHQQVIHRSHSNKYYDRNAGSCIFSNGDQLVQILLFSHSVTKIRHVQEAGWCSKCTLWL